MHELFEAEVVNIEPGDEVVTEIAAAGSIVDVAHIEGENAAGVANVGDVAGVANIVTVGVDDADVAGAVNAVDAFAEAQLDELVLELRQSPEKVLVTSVYS